jgi:hypothetical protein
MIFPCCKILQYSVLKNIGLDQDPEGDPDPHRLKMVDPYTSPH